MGDSRFDIINAWSEIKLEIIKEYASAYSQILSNKKALYHVYIDGFSSSGLHISKTTGEFVLGSPRNALLVKPPFREYYLVDLSQEKTDELREFASGRPDVHVYTDDCNAVLLNEVFPRVRYDQYRRGLCLLDPYGLHLNWEVVQTAGQSKTIQIFLNFPVMDMNMNVLHRNPEDVDPKQADRMTAFWGDTSWRQAAYSTEENLFGYEEKLGNEAIAEAFRRRLRDVAGFSNVPKPIPMRNSTGSIVYYLFFASQIPVAANIVTDIFNKYRNRGAQ